MNVDRRQILFALAVLAAVALVVALYRRQISEIETTAKQEAHEDIISGAAQHAAAPNEELAVASDPPG